MKIFKILDGGKPPYYKLFLAITQHLIAWFQWNYV